MPKVSFDLCGSKCAVQAAAAVWRWPLPPPHFAPPAAHAHLGALECLPPVWLLRLPPACQVPILADAVCHCVVADSCGCQIAIDLSQLFDTAAASAGCMRAVC